MWDCCLGNSKMTSDDDSDEINQHAGETNNTIENVDVDGDLNVENKTIQNANAGDDIEIPDAKGENQLIDFFERLSNLPLPVEKLTATIGGIGAAGFSTTVLWFVVIQDSTGISTSEFQMIGGVLLVCVVLMVFGFGYWSAKWGSECPQCGESWAVRTNKVHLKGRTATEEGADAVHVARNRECQNCGYSETDPENWSARDLAT